MQLQSPPSPKLTPPVPQNAYSLRREKLIENSHRENMDGEAVLVCDATDIRYLTGVEEGISWLIVSRQGTIAISRHMLFREVSSLIPDCEVLLPCIRSTDLVELEGYVTSQLHKRFISHAWIDTTKVPASVHQRLSEACRSQGISLYPAARMISNLRAIKQPEELRLINNCIEIAEISMRNLIQHGASKFLGRSERDIAVELERIMVTHGADRQGFPGSGIIVASGPNSASAHHRPGPRIVQSGDPVLIDWGAEYEGYRSDMTRTFFVRSLPDYAITGYPVVELALRKAAALLRAGQTLGSVDRTARETITSAGYEEFHYGVGHGVGLEIHEEPWIRSHSIETFCAGMVTTIEPGIYLNGIGGIRVENMFHIIEDRAENLTPFPTSIDNMILR